ncbi:MAG: FeoA family protein [Anaerolineae bacterium]|jgi:ferrous iron transport protein A
MHSKSKRRWAAASSGSNDNVVSLSVLHPGEHGEVVRLAGGRCMLSRMTALGFTPGVDVTVIQNYGRGPLIARVRDARIALGRGEAGRVYVRRRSQ